MSFDQSRRAESNDLTPSVSRSEPSKDEAYMLLRGQDGRRRKKRLDKWARRAFDEDLIGGPLGLQAPERRHCRCLWSVLRRTNDEEAGQSGNIDRARISQSNTRRYSTVSYTIVNKTPRTIRPKTSKVSLQSIRAHRKSPLGCSP